MTSPIAAVVQEVIPAVVELNTCPFTVGNAGGNVMVLFSEFNAEHLIVVSNYDVESSSIIPPTFASLKRTPAVASNKIPPAALEA